MTVNAYGPSHTPRKAIVIDEPVRCSCCNRKLMEMATRPWKARCPRCHAVIDADTEGIRVLEPGSR